jgi:hypothetical protein
MGRFNRKSASFGWNILKSDTKLLAYPLIRGLAMIVLLVVMWNLIFSISPSAVDDAFNNAAQAITESVDSGSTQENQGGGQTPEYGQDQEYKQQSMAQGQETPENTQMTAHTQQAMNGLANVFGHMSFGWFLIFILINLLVGIISLGALTGQTLAIIRGESRSLGYGYGRAITRSPQLLGWWLVTTIVGVLLRMLESQRFVGLIIGLLIGAVWSILTFFSITVIMDKGYGPLHAITASKNVVVDVVKRATGEEKTNLRSVRRGIYAGGPLVIINFLLFGLIILVGYLDIRSLHGGGHGVSINIFAGLLILLYISGGFTSAIWAIIKTTVYLWAEEDKVPESVDASVLEKTFVNKPNLLASSH